MREAGGRLQGKVILVTGAYGGLGREASLACAREGATVVLLGRKVPQLNRLHDAIVAEGGEAVLYPMDLEGATPDDHAELAVRLDEAFGKLDGILHCAAHFKGLTPLELTDPADVARAMHVNLTAPVWLTMACLPLLRRAADASVVVVIDAPERTSRAYWGGYGLAQAGRAALVPMLDGEIGEGHVRVVGLEPGPMRTPLRAKAYLNDRDPNARPPADHADACVDALAGGPRGVTRNLAA